MIKPEIKIRRINILSWYDILIKKGEITPIRIKGMPIKSDRGIIDFISSFFNQIKYPERKGTIRLCELPSRCKTELINSYTEEAYKSSMAITVQEMIVMIRGWIWLKFIILILDNICTNNFIILGGNLEDKLE